MASTVRFYWFTGALASAVRFHLRFFRTMASTVRFYWFTGALASAVWFHLRFFRTMASTVRFYWFTGTLAATIRFYLRSFRALAATIWFHLWLAGTLRTAIWSHLRSVVRSVHVLARLALVHIVKISISPIIH
ncbi:hypothetical protein, partial [Robinsoniella peoriensis]|uniref:hypothetical protein n=1 Tax=Robinsoniella peoriensis TaxID=180332 RepID=UPI003752AF28